MTVAPDGTVEFSRRLRLDRLAAGDVEEALAATAAERAALAERFELLALTRLDGEVSVRRPADGPLIRVEGRVRAQVTQTCVVTLDPVTSEIDEAFVQLFTLAPAAEDGEVFVAPEDEDTPEPVQGGAIDLGEVLAEQLALALDPYPRTPGVGYADTTVGASDAEIEADAEASPFDALNRLKRGD